MTFQQSPYLTQQRSFPNDNIQALTVEVDRSYIDIAQKVNARTIGIFAISKQIVTGEQWYINGQPNKQQTLRQVYTTSGAGSIAHGINVPATSGFTRIYGTATDGTNWYPLPYVSSSNANEQISIQITSTNIVIAAGISAPTITSATIVLEWLSKV